MVCLSLSEYIVLLSEVRITAGDSGGLPMYSSMLRSYSVFRVIMDVKMSGPG